MTLKQIFTVFDFFFAQGLDKTAVKSDIIYRNNKEGKMPPETKTHESPKTLTPAEWAKTTQILIELCAKVENSKNGGDKAQKK